MSKNEFLIEKYENLMTDIKMYMSEISKSKVSDLKAQKIIISWTLKHVSAIIEHPVYTRCPKNVRLYAELSSCKQTFFGGHPVYS